MASLLDFLKLARPKQWAKSAFVLIGPLYALADRQHPINPEGVIKPALLAAVAFALVSSACYIVNDCADVEADRQHPRKKNRPIASGRVSVGSALGFAALLGAAGLGAATAIGGTAALWTIGIVSVYAANVVLYSLVIKRMVIADVMSLSAGFGLRVLGGCAAAAVSPSTWLLNCTLFFAMFLAFGKRLGERRTVEDATLVRAVQGKYTDELLRMTTVVTGVALLVTYAGYVESRHAEFMRPLPGLTAGFNLLWLTVVPATYGLLRIIVLLERGVYDDPTEVATKDLPIQLAGAAFVLLTIGAWWWSGGA